MTEIRERILSFLKMNPRPIQKGSIKIGFGHEASGVDDEMKALESEGLIEHVGGNCYVLKEQVKIFEVWMEGYAATGESAGAEFYGSYEAGTFKEAVGKAVEKGIKDKKLQESYYEPNKLTYWGCRFFDNESEARKGFG